MGLPYFYVYIGFLWWFADHSIFCMGVYRMTNGCYIIHDLRNGTEIRCEDYDVYLTYFNNELKPEGLGTRYLFSEITKARQCYHLRLVEESIKHGEKALS